MSCTVHGYIIYVAGFRKEQVKVQVNHLGFIIISGERSSMEGNRWRRFRKEIEIPPHCNSNAINARFMQSILTIVMPKKLNPIPHSDHQEIKQPIKDPKEESIHANPNIESSGHNSKFTASDNKENEFEGEADTQLTPESAREVVLKLFIVVILILLIASYVTDVCKSMVADSYFLN